MIRVLRAVIATAASVALLAGCAAPTGTPQNDDTPAADTRPLAELSAYPDPRAAEGPRTAVIASDVVNPIAEHPTPQLPVTVISHDPDGSRDVVVTDTSRVLALDLAGSLAATVWGLGLGDTLVGRDMSTSFPGIDDLPIVTSGAHSINAESVLALHPTLVLTDGTIGPRDVLEQLRQSGVTVVFLANDPSFEGAAQLARDTAEALGVPETGELLAEQITSEIDRVSAEVASLAPTASEDKLRVVFLYLRGGSGISYLFGAESGADHLIEALGARDVAAENGWEGMKPMTDEAMVEADPDVVLVMTHGLESAGGVDGLLAAKPSIALTAAGQHRRIIDMADDQILSFGPRSALVLEALARALYTEP